jgi:hypothetical protein
MQGCIHEHFHWLFSRHLLTSILALVSESKQVQASGFRPVYNFGLSAGEAKLLAREMASHKPRYLVAYFGVFRDF